MDEEQLKQKEQEELRALLDSPDEEDSSGEDQKNKDVTPPADNPDGKETKPEAGKDDKPNEEGSEDGGNEDNKDSKDKGKALNDAQEAKSQLDACQKGTLVPTPQLIFSLVVQYFGSKLHKGGEKL